MHRKHQLSKEDDGTTATTTNDNMNKNYDNYNINNSADAGSGTTATNGLLPPPNTRTTPPALSSRVSSKQDHNCHI